MNITEDQIELAAAVLPSAAPLARVIVSEKMQERAMERQKDKELELIRAKNEARDDAGFGGLSAGSSGDDAAERVKQQDEQAFVDSIESMKTDEDCSLCRQLLDGIKDVDAGDRAIALAEYGRFKQSVDDTEDVEAIRDEIGDMSVLREVMVREFNMEA